MPAALPPTGGDPTRHGDAAPVFEAAVLVLAASAAGLSARFARRGT
ncbi:MAG: hypothetical protein WD904_09265 [Dehalococcoidia bacterium]